MKHTGVWGNRGFLQATSWMLVFLVVVVMGRILSFRNPTADTLLSNFASITSSLIATGYFARTWYSTSAKEQAKIVWGWLTIGMGLWAIAEGIWAYYELLAGIEVPYPSTADFFWLVGYVPIILAILAQYRIYQTSPTARQKFIIGGMTLVFSLVIGVVVLLPILLGFDPQRSLESIINLAYPLLDSILLILIVVIVFALEQGRFGLTWRLIGLGLVATAVADLMFSYASWNEIYDPGGQLNAITLVIDTLFYISYLIMGLGAYSYKLSSESVKDVELNLVVQPVTKTSILVYVDREGKIISLSDNFLNLVGEQIKEFFIKKPLSDALKTSPEELIVLLTKTLEQGSLSTQLIKVKDMNGKIKDVWLTSHAVKDEQGNLICFAVVLRTILTAGDGRERALSAEQKQLIDHYLNITGDYRSEENQMIKTYFRGQLGLLFSLIQQFSGSTIANSMLESLSRSSSQNQWQFTFKELNIGIPDEYEGEVLAQRLSTLLAEAKTYAGQATNLRMVEQEMKMLDRQLSPENLQYVDKYQLRSVALNAV